MILDNLLNFSKTQYSHRIVRVIIHLYSVLWGLTNIMHISPWIGVSAQQMIVDVIGGELVKGLLSPVLDKGQSCYKVYLCLNLYFLITF